MTEWKILTLEWADVGKVSAGQEIGEFLTKLWPKDVKRKKVPRRLIRKAELIHHIRGIVEDADRIMSAYGEDCHQNTYGLCKCIADKRSHRYVYYHFDHHPDDSRAGETIMLGNFVEELLRDTNAVDIRFIGNAIEPRIRPKGLDLGDVYLSVDLDFMSSSEIQTRYSSGTWKREELLLELDDILEGKNVISADCLGYYGREDAKSNLLYACVCGRIVGKDTSELEGLHDLARDGRLGYDEMFEVLGLEPSRVRHSSPA